MVVKKRSKSYGLSNPLQDVFPEPVVADRAPTPNDVGFLPGQTWIDQAVENSYVFIKTVNGQACWTILSAGTSVLDSLTGDTGGALTPSGGNINILGGDTSEVNGAGSTLTVNTSTNGYPISPFVVSLNTSTGGYLTIQLAIDAAVAVGGHSASVYILPGIYTENLDFTGTTVFTAGISIIGATAGPKEDQVEIIGTHTPALTGKLSLRNLDFSAGGGSTVFTSVAAGNSAFDVNDCNFTTVGTSFFLENWLAPFRFFNVDTRSGNDGFFRNVASASFIARSSTLGADQSNQIIFSGNVTLRDCDIGCRTFFLDKTIVDAQNIKFNGETSFSGNANGIFNYCEFSDEIGNAGILFNSTANTSLRECIVDSSGNPSIAGTGSGTISLTGVAFIDNKNIGASLTISGESLVSDTFKTTDTSIGLAISSSNITAVGTGFSIPIFLEPKNSSVECEGDLRIVGSGNKLLVTGGGDGDFLGQKTLLNGTVTISNSNIAASDRVLVTREGVGASTALGILDVSITASTSFTITALQAGSPGSTETNDVSIVSYFIVREA